MAKDHYCGFCGKAQDEVKKLIAGPCIEICNECIDMAHKIVHEREPFVPGKPDRKVLSFEEGARKHRPS